MKKELIIPLKEKLISLEHFTLFINSLQEALKLIKNS